ncbi:MAG TPA: tRNA 2-thiocytidine biosynthesis protein TtcA [Papillibacter sp.]|jgi:tRNA(Ile)-lysidine synthase TilS/MesJ|nr:tRNA 2-thiocytidine biosynthesis protein TtcA [Papillibacter sp.]
MERHEEIQRSITKKFRKEIWKRFTAAVVKYDLIQEGDKIAVCISGGKDSTLLALCMRELLKHRVKNFEVVYLVMDPGYNDLNRQVIVENAELLQLPISIFESDIFDVVAQTDRSPCYLCAKMRRGYLYSRAKALGCNKIALGHHFDDVIETTLLSMFYGAEVKTMMPKLHSTNYEGMELIRPLYMVREADIIAWRRYNDLRFIQCACRFTENCVLGDGSGVSKRQEIKALLKKLRQTSPNIDVSIFNSMHNVNLNTVLGYTDGDGYHFFLDTYDKKTSTDSEDDE